MNSIKTALAKYNKMSLPVKAAAWYSVCNILQKGISFLVVPLYVRLLTTAEYGEYTVFQSWRDVLIIFATLNLYCGVFTKAMVDYQDDRDRYTSSMQGLSSLITGGLLAVYLLRPGFWNGLLDMGTVTMLLMFVYFLVFPAFSFWSVRQRVEYKYKRMVIVTLAVSVLTPVVSIALLVFTELRANAVIWGFLITQNAVGLFFYVINFIRGKCFFHKAYWKHAFFFNIPLIPHYLSLIVLGQADRIMIKSICGADKAGIYSLAYSISLLLNVIIAAINNSLTPWMYEKLKHKDFGKISKTGNGICMLIGLMTVGVMLIAPELVMILGTAEYAQAIWVMPAVSMSVFFTFCYGLYSNIEFYYSATGYVMVASTVGAVLNIILNALLIPVFGFVAAGYTTLASYFVLLVVHYFFARKVSRKNIGGAQVLDVKTMVLLSLALVGMMCLCLLLYSNTVVRYVVIVLMLLAVAAFRKKLMAFVKNLLK